MRRRRHRHHHAEALTAALALAVAALATGSAAADSAVTRVSAGGPVHRVAVESSASGSGYVATLLRHSVQYPDGSTASDVVPGTEDLAIERDPALAIDPSSDAPILVWARNAGAGFDLLVARFDGGAWSDPRVLFADGADNSRPEIRVGKSLVQVFWRQDLASGSRRLRVVLDRETLDPVLGPEDLSTEASTSIPIDGAVESTAAGTPTSDLVYYASDFPGATSGDLGRIVIWGARDEPVPIVYQQSFLPPSDGLRLRRCTAEWIADRLVLSFVSGSSFYYTSRIGESWTDLRLIALGNGVDDADAQLMLRDMVRREDSIPVP